MNNGIFVQDVYDKIGSDNGLPRPLVGNPSLPMPYHFGPESRLDFKNLILVVDLAFSQSNTITFIAAGTATRNFSIDWGDGIIEQYTSYNNTSYSHTYNARGIYTIQITGDVYAPRFSSASQPILIKINSFGQTIIFPANYNTAFRFNTNLIAVAANLPSNTTTIFQIFSNCAKLNDPNISLWNTSNIIDMNGSFTSATSFNQSLDNWNVRKVTSFSNMFQGATNFNSSLSGWALGADTAGTNCSSMFNVATSFNQDLSSWDVSKVTNFNSMFGGARSFNQSLNGWQLVSSGVNCASMFFNAINFNQNLGTWNTSGITNASSMFQSANNFTGQGIDSWTLPSVTTASNMFLNCFNLAPTGSLSGWDMGSCTDMSRMFYSAGNNVGSNFSGLNSWNTSSCRNMSEMFFQCRFNNSLSDWNVSNVTTFAGMFNGAIFFNQSLNSWNTISAIGTAMDSMFTNAAAFNGDVENFNTSNVTSFGNMFNGATSFNKPINSWNVGNATVTSNMFLNASSFNQTLDNWNVRKCTNMNGMFFGARDFNSSLNNWSPGLDSVGVDCGQMFRNARSFNQNLTSWNMRKVTSVSNMFFCDAIPGGNTPSAFQGDISNWNLAGLTANTSLDNFMGGKTLTDRYSTANYDALLIGWNNNKLIGANGVANWRTDLRPNFGGARYTAGGAAATARAALVSYGWTITDGGVA